MAALPPPPSTLAAAVAAADAAASDGVAAAAAASRATAAAAAATAAGVDPPAAPDSVSMKGSGLSFTRSGGIFDMVFDDMTRLWTCTKRQGRFSNICERRAREHGAGVKG